MGRFSASRPPKWRRRCRSCPRGCGTTVLPRDVEPARGPIRQRRPRRGRKQRAKTGDREPLLRPHARLPLRRSGNVSPAGHPFDGLTGREANPRPDGKPVPVSKIDPSQKYAYFPPGANPGEGYYATKRDALRTAAADRPRRRLNRRERGAQPRCPARRRAHPPPPNPRGVDRHPPRPRRVPPARRPSRARPKRRATSPSVDARTGSSRARRRGTSFFRIRSLPISPGARSGVQRIHEPRSPLASSRAPSLVK